MAAVRATPPGTPSPAAPWAEIAPDAPYPMTVDELHALPDDGWAYELVRGVLVRMPLSSFGASSVGYRLGGRLSVYVEDNGLGVVTGEQGGYRLDPAHPLETELAPDVAFVRADRLPSPASPDYYKRAPQLAPDLAVEVASENQFAPGMATKAITYLTFGTRLVWIIWPRYKRVDVWHPGDDTPTSLGVEDTLDGEGVVPGFTYPIARLFP
jgi:Uma2 family endonuclease